MIVSYIAEWLNEVVRSRGYGDFQKRLLQKYLKDYIAIDQTEAEKYGTGKFTNLFWSGIWNASDIMHRDGLHILVDGLGILYAVVILAIKTPTFYHFLVIITIMIV